ncbi:MAG: hypothetical protein AVDCRST_MAG44-1401 [uncultured Sphingomonas sp.]|uniref:Glycine zipper family protein n=1 Tax=uncultured Sphingomonas sp. TaxID=158754 RepID=A0A6J4T187_9SPHN|nr:MAG: hypothetical protein AVDCRST_MAG44-1401 [uncultured Sphingomonas sp.]
MKNKGVGALAAVALLAACSSRPREFSPVLAAPAADQAAYNRAVAECGQLLAAGKLTSEGRLASGAAGAAASGAALAVGSAAASTAGMFGGLAVAGATIVLLPFAAIGGAYGMAKAKQKRKERAIQTAMAGCLGERGYQVAGWQQQGKVIPVRKAADASQ